MITVRSTSRWSAILLLLSLVAVTPLLGGCLERSTTVGDRFSGTVIVATAPDNPRGTPQLDVPESMASRITLTDYSTVPESESATPDEDSAGGSSADGGDPAAEGTDEQIPYVGTRAVFTDLTSGQFGQLGDIVAAAFGDSAMSMDLTAKRSDDVVRFRGNADLSDLTAGRDLVELTVVFGGPVTATNGEQIGERTVHWSPESGKPADFSADATYPDPATAAVSSWSWFVALLCLVVVALVVRLAFANRDRSPRPGRPRRNRKTGGGSTAPTPTSQSTSDADSSAGSGTRR
ncbi:LppM family (lipo)protein [Gordonia mangrovi]|uniref:LppM family (lipo)protein n=1 Tax=Gordonia mangrovi TaxID=2665643 RepID=UPI001F2B4AC3|nr:DUF3153 domain-containing protein [Gordonia mangrovi]MDY6811195.1 DUF3153 domain-containing protein [Actinomycetota bacterium]UVF78354.1 DUF3153 domain-containing protein [Gordonia mangrovi]